MHIREKLNFYKSDELIMLELPYKDDKAHVCIVTKSRNAN